MVPYIKPSRYTLKRIYNIQYCLLLLMAGNLLSLTDLHSIFNLFMYTWLLIMYEELAEHSDSCLLTAWTLMSVVVIQLFYRKCDGWWLLYKYSLYTGYLGNTLGIMRPEFRFCKHCVTFACNSNYVYITRYLHILYSQQV